MTRIVFVDCETTGLRPDQGHTPWEIAVITREPGLPDAERVWQLRPDLAAADPESLAVCRFDERFVVPDGVDAVEIDGDGGLWKLAMHEALHDIQHALEKATLVAANPAFDDAMLKALLLPHRRKVTWHYRLMCVESMAAAVLGWETPRKLSESAEALGVAVDPAVAHTALGDARTARDVYDAALVITGSRLAAHQEYGPVVADADRI